MRRASNEKTGPWGLTDLLKRYPKRQELQRRGLRELRDLAFKGKGVTTAFDRSLHGTVGPVRERQRRLEKTRNRTTRCSHNGMPMKAPPSASILDCTAGYLLRMYFSELIFSVRAYGHPLLIEELWTLTSAERPTSTLCRRSFHQYIFW